MNVGLVLSGDEFHLKSKHDRVLFCCFRGKTDA
jgi:hypothetical protein